MERYIKIFLLLSVILVDMHLPGDMAFAATWYIDPLNGHDSNPGHSVTMAKKMVNSICSRLAPGDTVYLRGTADYGDGQYFFQNAGLGVNGTRTAPITIRAYPGERPRFTGSGYYNVYFALAKNWYILDGLEFSRHPSVYVSILLDKAAHVTIRNCTFTGATAIRADQADYNTIEYNTATSIGGPGSSGEGVGAFVVLRGAQHNLIANNTVASIGHAAVDVLPYPPLVRLSAYNIIRNNLIDQAPHPASGKPGGGGGIYILVQSHHNEITGNNIRGVGGHPGIRQNKSGLSAAAPDNIFRNNRVESYGRQGCDQHRGMYVNSTSNFGNVNVVDNLFEGNFVGPGYGIALYVREGIGSRASGVNVARNIFRNNVITTPYNVLDSPNYTGRYTPPARYPIYIGSYQDGAWPAFANGNIFEGTSFLKPDGTPEDRDSVLVKIAYYYGNGGFSKTIESAYSSYPTVFREAPQSPVPSKTSTGK